MIAADSTCCCLRLVKPALRIRPWLFRGSSAVCHPRERLSRSLVFFGPSRIVRETKAFRRHPGRSEAGRRSAAEGSMQGSDKQIIRLPSAFRSTPLKRTGKAVPFFPALPVKNLFQCVCCRMTCSRIPPAASPNAGFSIGPFRTCKERTEFAIFLSNYLLKIP